MRLAGFTLIESVIFIAIMSILVTIVVVRIPSITFYKSYNFANMLQADLQLTKILSITQNQRYRLVTTASAYQIQDQTGAAFLDPATNNSSITYPTSVTVSPLTTVVFDSLGKPYDAAGTALTTALIFSITATDMSANISVSPQTGFIQ